MAPEVDEEPKPLAGREGPVCVAVLGPLRQAFFTWISEFLTGRLSMSVSLLRKKLALNPETSKKE
jgi:hypothetical protein